MPTIKVDLPDEAVTAFCAAYNFDALGLEDPTDVDRLAFAEDQVVGFIKEVLRANLVGVARQAAEETAQAAAEVELEKVVVVDSPKPRVDKEVPVDAPVEEIPVK